MAGGGGALTCKVVLGCGGPCVSDAAFESPSLGAACAANAAGECTACGRSSADSSALCGRGTGDRIWATPASSTEAPPAADSAEAPASAESWTGGLAAGVADPAADSAAGGGDFAESFAAIDLDTARLGRRLGDMGTVGAGATAVGDALAAVVGPVTWPAAGSGVFAGAAALGWYDESPESGVDGVAAERDGIGGGAGRRGEPALERLPALGLARTGTVGPGGMDAGLPPPFPADLAAGEPILREGGASLAGGPDGPVPRMGGRLTALVMETGRVGPGGAARGTPELGPDAPFGMLGGGGGGMLGFLARALANAALGLARAGAGAASEVAAFMGVDVLAAIGAGTADGALAGA